MLYLMDMNGLGKQGREAKGHVLILEDVVLIKSTLMPAISPMNLGNDENKDVQWIQLLTGKGVFFFAIVYSRPSDTAGH